MFSIKFEVEVDFLFMQTFDFDCLFLNYQSSFNTAWTDRNLFGLPNFIRASLITIPDSRGSNFRRSLITTKLGVLESSNWVLNLVVVIY